MSAFTLIKDLIANSVKLKLSRNAAFARSVERTGAAGGDPGAGTVIGSLLCWEGWTGRVSAVGDALQQGASTVLLRGFHSDRTVIYMV